MTDQEALRKQHNAPDLTSATNAELITYIERLEQGIIDLARVRNVYADALYEAKQGNEGSEAK